MIQPDAASVPFSEADLVVAFCKMLSRSDDPWNTKSYATEFEYLRGRTDIILADRDGRVIAIEAKLLKWRDALNQAYRNGCFAHKSFVLLPENVAKKAEKFLNEFSRRSVGLCSVTPDGIVVLIDSEEAMPIQPILTQRALQLTESGG